MHSKCAVLLSLFVMCGGGTRDVLRWVVENHLANCLDELPAVMIIKPQKYFATTKRTRRLIILSDPMKNLLPLVFAIVVSVACLIPARASAYYYRGRYYPYYYRGHYYSYYSRGHYYRYYRNGHYYRHRAWVAGPRGYYRYW
jgi:hypothetical protein